MERPRDGITNEMLIEYWNIVICDVDPTSNLGLIYLIHWELQAQISTEIT